MKKKGEILLWFRRILINETDVPHWSTTCFVFCVMMNVHWVHWVSIDSDYYYIHLPFVPIRNSMTLCIWPVDFCLEWPLPRFLHSALVCLADLCYWSDWWRLGCLPLYLPPYPADISNRIDQFADCSNWWCWWSRRWMSHWANRPSPQPMVCARVVDWILPQFHYLVSSCDISSTKNVHSPLHVRFVYREFFQFWFLESDKTGAVYFGYI